VPYSETVAERVRELLADQETLREQPMFGGLSLMVHGNLACGVHGEDLIVRLSPEDGAAALAEPHAREMDFTGRPMRGWLFVGPVANLEEAAFDGWVRRSLAHCLTLQPK
jgi:hypothetical protein